MILAARQETENMQSVMRANPWPFKKENKELYREQIARKAMYGKESERLNLN
jgi:hypothetical protein